MRVGGWRWIRGVQCGEIDKTWFMGKRWTSPTSTRMGVEEDEVELGDEGKEEERSRDEREEREERETSVDETLGRCWMIVHAIAAGWGQHDLVMDLENLFN